MSRPTRVAVADDEKPMRLRWLARRGNGGAEPTIAGWGRLGVPGAERRAEDLAALTAGAVLTRGLGRSYGDASLPPPSAREVASSVLADRILAFDPATGLLCAEAGLSLETLNRIFLPRTPGFCSPVLPGTQYVTLGGMVAADVHGKEHHVRGCFGRHVERLRLRVASGEIVECDRGRHADLFAATLGGMGLTGHILEVTFRLQPIPSPWVEQETRRVPDIDAFMAALEQSARALPYTVGWIDCLTRGRHMGRGILIGGRWAEPGEAPARPPRARRKLAVPFELPSWALSALTVRGFNFGYYHKHRGERRAGIVHPDSFFHPLDAILHWNRIYGPRGFTQYQCVLPREAGPEAPRRFLELLTSRGGASFLCVIKDCGAEGEGLLSFPLRGVSIALDIPVRADTQALVDTLNEHVLEAGGRVYLAKDAFTRAEHYRRMEPRLERFLEVRDRWDPERRIRSALSVRLLGDPP